MSATDLSPGRRSATASVSLGLLGLAGVLCLLFPAWLTTPGIRERYPLDALRAVLQASLALGLGFGAYGLFQRGRRRWSALGFGASALGVLLGGAWVEVPDTPESALGVGLDWFVLNLALSAALFVPLEQLAPRVRSQRLLRTGFAVDLGYFALSHLLVRLLLMLSTAPVVLAFGRLELAPVHAAVQRLPWAAQLLLAVVVTDLCSYWIHRLAHTVPWLWRFHRIHHTSEALDWLAASRLHLVDIVVSRGVAFVPLFALGFEPAVVAAYLSFVAVHAVFNHTNVRWRLAALDRWLTTPHFHHWHHAAEPEAIHANFAAQLPLWDRLFGTHRQPTRWPHRYGLADPP